LKRNKFKLPPSLKGKVFRADRYFHEKARSPASSYLVQNLSHTKRIQTPDGFYIHRKIKVSLEKEASPEGYVFPGGKSLCLDPLSLGLLSGERDFKAYDISRMIFLDLETTGLAGGTGTYPFLCGIGYFEQNSFIVEQFFMEDYPYERVMLESLGQRLKTAEALVTFNGKSFDVPLLITRFIFNRIRVNLELPHIDLLHPSRRIWKGAFPDCRLETIEQEFFKLKRKRDIESHLIPHIYFQFVRGKSQELMLPVFDHNAQDIISLGALLSFFCRILSQPESGELTRSAELWGLGRLFLKFGLIENAIQSLDKALYLSKETELTETLLFHMGRLYKKMGRFSEANEIWERLFKRPSSHKITAAVELAKYYEHKAKQPHLAREIVVKVTRELSVSEELEGYISGINEARNKEITPELEKRLRRLEAKIKRQQKRRPNQEKGTKKTKKTKEM